MLPKADDRERYECDQDCDLLLLRNKGGADLARQVSPRTELRDLWRTVTYDENVSRHHACIRRGCTGRADAATTCAKTHTTSQTPQGQKSGAQGIFGNLGCDRGYLRLITTGSRCAEGTFCSPVRIPHTSQEAAFGTGCFEITVPRSIPRARALPGRFFIHHCNSDIFI